MELAAALIRFAPGLLVVAAVGCTATPQPDAAATRTHPPAVAVTAATTPVPTGSPTPEPTVTAVPLATPFYETFAVPPGTRPHDVAPAADGGVWYTAQRTGGLGLLDPGSGTVAETPLGPGSAPHGVIVGPDGAPWITDGGQNAIVRVDPVTRAAEVFPLPTAEVAAAAAANLNTAAFDGDGVLWFTGQAGVWGRLDPAVAAVEVFASPRGAGPYGITTTPDGTVWLASLAGSYIGRIDGPGSLTVVDVPSPGGGARRVWSDSSGSLWVTEWFAGRLARYDPEVGRWDEWSLPGTEPRPYAVWVDDRDHVWISDFGGDALHRFDPSQEKFDSFPYPAGSDVRQLLGRPGEVWGAGSGTDTLLVLSTS